MKRKQNKIILNIFHIDGYRRITLSASNMSELKEKLENWWPKLAKDLPLLKQTQRFKKNPAKEERAERKSGWYIDA